MTIRRWRAFRLMLGGWMMLLGWSMAGSASAAPTVAQILRFAPRQQGVECDTPTTEEQAKCTVKLVQEGKGSGWILRDTDGLLRRFFDSDGNNKIDVWSFYKDSKEVYREIDTNANGKPDQYRWLNAGGQKWGIDTNEDGHVDGWKVISPEEVSQEIVRAIQLREYQRLQALMLTSADVLALDLEKAEKARFEKSMSESREKFREVLTKLKDVKQMKWLHLETDAPQCRPAASSGSPRADLVSHVRGAILFEASGKNDWLQTGALVRVGLAWKIVAAPTLGPIADQHVASGATNVAENKKLQALIEQLSELDKKAPPMGTTPGPNAKIVKHNLDRANLLEKIVAEVAPKEREGWIRQVADSLSTAAQSSPVTDKTALTRLLRLEEQITKAMPKSDLAAYVTFREMQADYATKLVNPKGDFSKIQQAWVERLSKFVSDYPKSQDTADALMQLGMVSEFLAKEADAKKWYGKLVSTFASHPMAAKARGALLRLDVKGKPLTLSGTLIDGTPYDVSRDRGKIVVVYYWASWNQQTIGDFAKLKAMLKTYEAKGVKLVSVNLDNTATEAKTFLRQHTVAGAHLHGAGGLESKLAVDYGIMVLPNLFLVDKTGKVVSSTVQMTTLEDEIKKLLK